MPKIFAILDKINPFYNAAHKVVLFICKLLLVIDILITCMAVAGRYVPFIPDPSWSEEVVLSCMAYMAVLSASLALHKNSHIRLTAFDGYLPKNLVNSLEVLADIAVFILAFIMITVGWKYAVTIGSKGTYVSMPGVSRFWMYFPIPLAGAAMIIFEIDVLYEHIKAFFVNKEVQQ